MSKKGGGYLLLTLDAVLEDGNRAVLLEALRNITESKGGISSLANETGLNRESLYKTLSENGTPKYETTIIKALGFRLSVSPLHDVA